ncbi:bifunctional demethylmenaquinone methyltransferase/2-methoxy-6-polyprenyl-1,4-benzoquinol methylase [Candidatus Legionella polyplacis]|uniref:bifunctional demethylmenaquinone methyltransferase/2-methoxy-6-polyprenyl-1,4-benzoquinol methylase UbiE n=1 Tax=Candidatus Legionella polyplacis TaxID=2005262 RepID=UPI000C1E8CD7|nr:bifunctional demethylmenaquinone methyltransferase/2-methoxy-6-polyprenyl-1,4-benzoquinol methylase UbiE [Candidatus Legionella polyplacis]ATW01875.1 bifunctional demethylmenaquinone methyltransferase/2-methoxy-6-polyprenyl-1,4-benzoquinol methylase [Candidatus Legionella polyplacis]
MKKTYDKTHFGYRLINLKEKEKKIMNIFTNVSKKYDLMNNIMSIGLHYQWKKFTVKNSHVKPGQTVLDLASGTGDITILLRKKMKGIGKFFLVDLNYEMLKISRNKLLDLGIINNTFFIQANAQSLPFNKNSFDCIIISFGLRNITDQEKTLKSMFNICKPGGKILILEFSHPKSLLIKKLYNLYSFYIIPKLGKIIAQDKNSYKYLVESIQIHPSQTELKFMIEKSGFQNCSYYDLHNGIVSLHIAYKY